MESQNIFNGAYFREHPEKVLGKIYTHNPNTGKKLTDGFGNARSEVRGSLSDALPQIEAPSVKKYKHFQKSTSVIRIDDEKSKAKIKLAIKKTTEQRNQKSKTNKVCGNGIQCLDDTIKKYNTEVEYKESGQTKYYTISEEEIKVWVTYQTNKGLFNKAYIKENAWGKYYVNEPNWEKWLDSGLVAYDGREYIPTALFYSGNIYAKINAQKNKWRDSIVERIGEDKYYKQLQRLEASTPDMLLITDDQTRKLYLSPFDKIWSEVSITQLADGSDVKGDVKDIFYFNYLNVLGRNELTVDGRYAAAYEIRRYWINKDRFPRGTSSIEKAAIKRNTTIVGQYLFDRFLIEMLSEEDKTKIAALWNAKRNNYRQIPYWRIPVGYTINENFKGGKLSIRPAQREGVAFMNSRGTGIVAYDVGVGKTMTAILGIADGFEKGLFKRPLIVVPQKVIKKWIAEIKGVFAKKDQIIDGKKVKKGELISEGILPNVVINDYDNLGVNVIERAKDVKTDITYTVPEFSVTIVTWEGLVKIGFSQETENILLDKITTVLSQGESGRTAALLEQRAEGWIEKALSKTEVDIEEMGIDAIIVDEAHGFRNLFMEIKGDVGEDGEREAKNFFSSSSGDPSARAVSLFMLNSYVQSKNRLRNTFGLTATPFTNRPQEVYSMMALYDYEGLKEFDTYNIAQFCTSFIDETMEDSWTAAGKFEPKAVVRGYNNLPTLQSMIFRAINYKTGEDANIQRPEKIILPLENDEKGIPLEAEYIVDTKLPPIPLQQKWMNEITKFASKQDSQLNSYYPTDSKGRVPGRVLISLNAARTVTFSPYALKLGSESQFNPGEVSYEKFVDNSPKIKYTIECIRSVRSYHMSKGTKISGQIIYADRGVEWFEHIKDYLTQNVGFEPSEVAIFTGKVSKGRRETIKENFLSGKIKVIIGSSTLREGVDLQKNGSTIYVCYLDWNPTDLHQLFGRIWRFGNKFSHVRIVIPLIENSSDIFTWQKLSEKMSRLNSVWAKANGTKMFNEGELNAEELKKALINDPEKLAKFELDEQIVSNTNERQIVKERLEALQKVEALKSKFASTLESIDRFVQEGMNNPSLGINTEQKQVDALKNRKVSADDIQSKYRFVKAYAKITRYNNKWTMLSAVDENIKARKKLKIVESSILEKYQLTAFDDFSPVVADLEEQFAKLERQKNQILNPEYKQSIIEKYRKEKEEEQAKSKSLEVRVSQFNRLNYLLDCEYGINECDIYGRVSNIKTGKSKNVDVNKESPVIVETTAFEMPKLLRTFMSKDQQSAVLEILSDENGYEYGNKVLMPIVNQLKSIPKGEYPAKYEGTLKKNHKSLSLSSKDTSIVWGHLFFQGNDYFIISYDSKSDLLFGYAILGGDLINAELGYQSLTEYLKTPSSVQVGNQKYNQYAELDLFWSPKYLAEALHNHSPSFYPKPKIRYEEEVEKGIEQRLMYVKKQLKPSPVIKVKESKKELIEKRIKALNISKQFSKEKDLLEKRIKALSVALKFV